MTVGERIEDVAGNRMNEALDHATTEKISEPHGAELWFSPREPWDAARTSPELVLDELHECAGLRVRVSAGREQCPQSDRRQ